MSALPPKADILRAIAKGLLMTHSGHSLDYAIQWGVCRKEVIAVPSPGEPEW